jgi:HK97 family phage portal protein
MGLIAKSLQRAGAALVKTGLQLERKSITTADLLNWAGGGSLARSGQYVSGFSALQVTTFFSCVKLISEDIAKVTCDLDIDDGRKIQPAKGHPVRNLLRYRPNDWQTPFQFKQMLLASAVMSGNGHAFITRGVDGNPKELIGLPPYSVFTRRQTNTWNIVHTINFPNGMGTMEVGPRNILHLSGLSFDGVTGADTVRALREALGLALAGEEHQARLARGGLRQSGYIKTSAEPTTEQMDKIKAIWGPGGIGGNANADKMPVIWGDQVYQELVSKAGKEEEILETRRFQVEEICRPMRVFPQMIGHTDKTATHGSASEFFGAHVGHTLQPWAKVLEETFERDLLTPDEVIEQGYGATIHLEELLRGNAKDRAAYYKDRAAVYSITPNEIRRMEGQNPLDLPGMDEPIGPVNMATIEKMQRGEVPKITKPPNPEEDENVD